MEQDRQARKAMLPGRVVKAIEAAPDVDEYSGHQTYQGTGREKEIPFPCITGQR